MTDDKISNEDKALFREHMREVKPLNKQKKRTTAPNTILAAPPRKKTTPIEIKPQNYYLSDYISDPVLPDTLLSYVNPDLPNKRFRALKNGQIPWEARLDLHGATTDDTRQSLCRFIQIQYQKHTRCVLIIHGKGGHQSAPPVIKNLINRWLPQLEEVLAFHSALAKDGGQGAVYVLLKRNRDIK